MNAGNSAMRHRSAEFGSMESFPTQGDVIMAQDPPPLRSPSAFHVWKLLMLS